eukprot:283026-Chlamydomonas_euryale.AAC.5
MRASPSLSPCGVAAAATRMLAHARPLPAAPPPTPTLRQPRPLVPALPPRGRMDFAATHLRVAVAAAPRQPPPTNMLPSAPPPPPRDMLPSAPLPPPRQQALPMSAAASMGAMQLVLVTLRVSKIASGLLKNRSGMPVAVAGRARDLPGRSSAAAAATAADGRQQPPVMVPPAMHSAPRAPRESIWRPDAAWLRRGGAWPLRMASHGAAWWPAWPRRMALHGAA